MRTALLSSLVVFAASAAGLIITSPQKGEKVDFSKPVTIKWQSVSTDPSTFDIVLVNENVYPPTTEKVAAGVDSEKGSFTIHASSNDLSTTESGGGYQVNILTAGGGILAQSPQFKATGPKAESETTTGSVSTTTTTTDTTTMTALSTTSTSTSTATTTTKHMRTTETSTATPTAASNAASLLVSPNQVGSLLLGLMALAL